MRKLFSNLVNIPIFHCQLDMPKCLRPHPCVLTLKFFNSLPSCTLLITLMVEVARSCSWPMHFIFTAKHVCIFVVVQKIGIPFLALLVAVIFRLSLDEPKPFSSSWVLLKFSFDQRALTLGSLLFEMIICQNGGFNTRLTRTALFICFKVFSIIKATTRIVKIVITDASIPILISISHIIDALRLQSDSFKCLVLLSWNDICSNC